MFFPILFQTLLLHSYLISCHLFDQFLIKGALDIIEAAGSSFHLVKWVNAQTRRLTQNLKWVLIFNFLFRHFQILKIICVYYPLYLGRLDFDFLICHNQNGRTWEMGKDRFGTSSTSSNPIWFGQFTQRKCIITRLHSDVNGVFFTFIFVQVV